MNILDTFYFNHGKKIVKNTKKGKWSPFGFAPQLKRHAMSVWKNQTSYILLFFIFVLGMQ